MIYYQDKDLTVRTMLPSDCQAFHQGFAAQGWNKPLSQFERYFEEQGEGIKKVLVAAWRGEAAGYTTLLPQAPAGPFAGKGWPEVCDFNVLEKFQRRGIGSRILAVAEDLASQTSGTICLGVGLHSGYGAAQRLYVKRGYMFDGSGLWYRDKPLAQYAPCAADDDLVLYLSRKLVRREFRPLTREELAPELFRCFDRFQIVEKCWRKVEGQWVVKDVVFTERWGEEDYRFLCQCLQNTVATGGQVWGAFLEGRLKGFASVEGPLIGSQTAVRRFDQHPRLRRRPGPRPGAAAVPAGGGDRPPAGGQGAVHLRPFVGGEPGLLQGDGLCGGNRVYPRPRGAGALRLPAGVPVIKTREPLLPQGRVAPFLYLQQQGLPVVNPWEMLYTWFLWG